MKRIALLLLLSVSIPDLYAVDPEPVTTTVILVRHAEKSAPDGDPPLSDAGHARAKELARALTSARVSAIYATQYLRTQQTAQPLAELLGIEPKIVKAGVKEYAGNVVREIREQHAGGTVLVVGHLNTTVDVLRELGVRDLPAIPESQYDDLFVVTLVKGAPPALVALRYGVIAR